MERITFTPFLLFFLGIFLIYLEFYLPGAVLGILGSLIILASVFVFASQSDSILLIFLYLLGVGITIGFLIRFALWRIVHAKPEYSIYSDKDQEGFQASQYDRTALGKVGTVLSDLKPGGYILVDGNQHQAISLEGYLPKGSEVIVLSGQEESLLVKLYKKDSAS
jgi:membrane-bound serine protease (ClpP class)